LNWDRKKLNRLSKYIQLPVSMVLLIMLVFFIESSIQLRSRAVILFFLTDSSSQGALGHHVLVTSYELNKKLYSKSISQKKFDEASLELEATKKEILGESRPTMLVGSGSDRFTLWLINFIRLLLYKDLLANQAETDFNTALYTAYFYEQNFEYEKAIASYHQALDETRDYNLRAGIMLHQGYCHAMLSHNRLAKQKYEYVMNHYNESEIAVTASILLSYLAGFQMERERILKMNKYSIGNTEKLIQLFAFENAWEMLDQVAKTGDTQPYLIRYYKARLLERQGKRTEAADLYLDVVLDNKSGEIARQALRKIYFMGARSGDKGLIQIATRINKSFQDPELSALISSGRLDEFPTNYKYPVTKAVIDKNKGEKIDEILDARERMANQNISQAPPQKRVSIITYKGDRINGVVVASNKKQIILRTSIGKIKIDKSNIKEIINLE